MRTHRPVTVYPNAVIPADYRGWNTRRLALKNTMFGDLRGRNLRDPREKSVALPASSPQEQRRRPSLVLLIRRVILVLCLEHRDAGNKGKQPGHDQGADDYPNAACERPGGNENAPPHHDLSKVPTAKPNVKCNGT